MKSNMYSHKSILDSCTYTCDVMQIRVVNRQYIYIYIYIYIMTNSPNVGAINCGGEFTNIDYD